MSKPKETDGRDSDLDALEAAARKALGNGVGPPAGNVADMIATKNRLRRIQREIVEHADTIEAAIEKRVNGT